MQNRVYSQFWLDYADGTIELDEEFTKRDGGGSCLPRERRNAERRHLRPQHLATENEVRGNSEKGEKGKTVPLPVMNSRACGTERSRSR